MTLVNKLESLKATIGWSSSPSTVITSFVFVLITYFFLYSLASYLHIPIVIFQNGVTYNAQFENTYILTKNMDGYLIVALFIIWLMFSLKNKKFGLFVSSIYVGSILVTLSIDLITLFNLIIFTTFPLILFVIFLNRVRARDKSILNNRTNSLAKNYFSISIIICSAIGIILASSILIFSITPSELLIHNYAYPLYVLFSNATPLLIFLLIFSFLVKYIILRFRSDKSTGNKSSVDGYAIISLRSSLSLKVRFVSLLIFMTIAVILCLIPQNPIVNETDQLIGVDTDEYMNWISEMLEIPDIPRLIEHFLLTQSTGDRPLTLSILLLFTHAVSANNPSVIEFAPLLLGPLLVIVVYLFTRELTSNDTISLISAFLTAVSVQMLIGLYAGLYANWIALIIGYLSFVFLIKYLKNGIKIHLFSYSALIILTLLTHVYTWTIFTVFTGILLVVLIKVNLFERRRVVLLYVSLFISIVFDIARIVIHGSSSSEVQLTTYLLETGLSIGEFTNWWNNLVHTVQIYVGGIYSNFVIFALGLYWLIQSKTRDFNTIFIMIFLSIGIIPLFLGGEMIKARVFYEIPFQIPAAIALWQISNNSAGKLIIFSVCSWMLFVAVRTSFNLYLIEPL